MNGRATLFSASFLCVIAAASHPAFAQGTHKTIAVTGQQAPGTATNVNFNTLSAPVLNNAGQVAYVVGLTGAGVDSTNDRGIWVTGPNGQSLLIARKGDPLAGRTVSGLNIITGSNESDSRGRSLINNFSQVAYRAVFTNGDHGVFLFTPTLHWHAPSSGHWDTAHNWTIAQIPGQPHDVILDPSANVTITGPTQNTTIQSLTISEQNSGVTTLQLEHDVTLAVTDGVALDGNLDILADPSATPQYGQQFSVLTYGSRTGTFDNITGTMLNSTLALAPVFDFAGNSQFAAAPDSLTLFVTAPGDANLDLIVDFTDLAFLASNFNKNFQPLIGTSFDGATAIPEPGTLGLIVVVGGLLLTRRRK